MHKGVGSVVHSWSLSGSLIDQDIITVNTLPGKRCQRTVNNQVDVSAKQLLQVFVHAEELQAYGLGMVKDYEYIHIAVLALLAPCIGAEEPSLQDGLRLEVFGYRLLHCLIAHRLYTFVFHLQI